MDRRDVSYIPQNFVCAWGGGGITKHTSQITNWITQKDIQQERYQNIVIKSVVLEGRASWKIQLLKVKSGEERYHL